ncbi:MAG: 23S rRNA (uracil(1939)-C(5))-methyltransferase RlmD, partial [Hungatella sp.]
VCKLEDHKKRNNRPKAADNRPKAADSRPKAAAGRAKPVDRRESICPVFKQCGACQMLSMPYEQQLEAKQKTVEDLLKKYCTVRPITGMKEPYHYRNKVHAVFGHQKGAVISGVYKANSHDIVPVERCMIEDEKADEIIGTIRAMLKSFKIRTYDEDSGYGLLRHVLVKRGFTTGEIMVVLVMASPIFPSRNNFIQVLREKHPEITTIIQNVNDRNTSMVLGDKEKTLYGKGYIEDVLSGCTFRISSKSFYQINPVQTEFLYDKAISLAALTGKETVIDAYCGIGTIGIIAGNKAGKVIGVELNKDAIRDAVQNAKCNQIANIQFYNHDAGAFMTGMASQGEKVDVVFMDPPRSGSTEEFIDSVAVLHPDRVIYISCNPVTLERDLQYFKKKGYGAKEAWPFDLFPQTGHVECVCLMTKNK